MKLNHGLHLAYCTNIHRGENWRETFESLKTHTLAVRKRVCEDKPYAIGLRLSNQAALELSDAATLKAFQGWLEQNDCYVFTITGFPFGRFHGGRVKEQVYAPDWTSAERLAYTNRLFDLLSELVPPGVEGSVSTLPGSFKEFITSAEQEKEIRNNIWRCVEHIARVSERTGRVLHLGLEPEPLGWFENSAETIRFFEQMRAEQQNDPRLDAHLGVNYDTCHLAVEFEEPARCNRGIAGTGHQDQQAAPEFRAESAAHVGNAAAGISCVCRRYISASSGGPRRKRAAIDLSRPRAGVEFAGNHGRAEEHRVADTFSHSIA